jgi:hypothetical protein
MKYHRILAAAFAALISSPLPAQWWSGNEKISDEPWRRGKRDFGAMLLLTPDVEKFYKEWTKPETPNIATAESTTRNKPLTAVVLFTGCKVDGGNCNIRVDFIVLKPDGSNYGSQKDVAAWVKKPGARKGVVQVSEASLRIVIEPNDPAGKYIVKAIVRDLNAKVILELEHGFTVAESPA